MTGVANGAHAGCDELIFIEPVYLTKVWGGTRLRDDFGYDLPDDNVGECLAFSARPEGDCRVRGGRFDGLTLSALWSEHRGLFGGLEASAFPLQVKILDAADDLSVQVHPTPEYAAAHEDDAGKNECWYVLGASASGRILIGHEAPTREEFGRMAGAGCWADLLRSVAMTEGDFFYIPAGTVHAILAGSLIYEVQQPSNVTYRLFDYDRLDNGVVRDLHLEKALDVVVAPARPAATPPTVTTLEGATRRFFMRGDDFTVSTWDVATSASIPVDAPFLLVSALEGKATINGVSVTKGDHFIVPSCVDALDVSGAILLIVTAP